MENLDTIPLVDGDRCADCPSSRRFRVPRFWRPCRCPEAYIIPPEKHVHVSCPRHGKTTFRSTKLS